jgi:TonB family protein
MVEPEVPQRVLDGMNRNTAVMVDLTIRANGSVAAVELVPPAPRQLQRYLAAALEQWRFDPLPAERVHRIELVFNADR